MLEEGYVTLFIDQANDKYMTNYAKNKELQYLQYLDVINLYGFNFNVTKASSK